MHMYNNECLYIAGPECFYKNGNQMLDAMRRKAESHGFSVSLPNDNPLDLSHKDLRKNGDAIFENCAQSMLKSTAIVVDLETFRGCEPDGGSIYEIGMAYALGLRCYAYSRDMRSMTHKYPGALLQNGEVYDQDGRPLPYAGLPFAPSIVGSCKLVQGDYYDCLKVLMQDLDEERKLTAKRQAPAKDLPAGVTLEKKPGKPVLYLATTERYNRDAAESYARYKALAEGYGFTVLTPLDKVPGVPRLETSDSYARAYNTLDRWQQQVRNCDLILADLNDFHGWEPNSDVSFECGMAWQLGKACFGYMADTTNMRGRIPHYGPEMECRDIYGNDVENFDYPINLMFASSMPILQGSFEQALAQVAAQYKP